MAANDETTILADFQGQTDLTKQLLRRLHTEDGEGRIENCDQFRRVLTENLESKRLFVCCDGTWKDAVRSKAPLTNVGKLARAVYRLGSEKFAVPEGDGPLDKDHLQGLHDDRYGLVRQIVYYSSGLGSQSSLVLESGFSGATGKGVSASILNAYSFICNNYNFISLQDEIILVGFSRGAFTVRCLAYFIEAIGLLRRKALVLLPIIYRDWKRHNGHVDPRLLSGLEFLRQHPVKVKILAEWDPVSAMAPGNMLSFVKDRVPGNVDNAFLALALNEKRKSFQPELWKSTASAHTKVRQCAFVGCHSDIGGGNRDPGLSTVTLLWMISQIEENSAADFDYSTLLQFLTPLQHTSRLPWKKPKMPRFWNLASTKGQVHESRVGWWTIPYILSLGFWDGKRDRFLDRYTCMEAPQPEPQIEQATEDTFGYPSLKIHFTARLLGSQLSRDSGLKCGLFQRFTSDMDSSQRHVWRSTKHRRQHLVEDAINDAEKRLLGQWIPKAQRFGDVDRGLPAWDTIDDEDWGEVLRRMRIERHEPGCAELDSLVHLIRNEFLRRDWNPEESEV